MDGQRNCRPSRGKPITGCALLASQQWHPAQDELARYTPVTHWSLPEFSPWEQVATQVQTPIERSANLLVSEWTDLTEVLSRWRIEEPAAEIDGGGI